MVWPGPAVPAIANRGPIKNVAPKGTTGTAHRYRKNVSPHGLELFVGLPLIKQYFCSGALAPTQSEPAFAITQATMLLIFIVIALIAVANFRLVTEARI